jgi:hypothetical protein
VHRFITPVEYEPAFIKRLPQWSGAKKKWEGDWIMRKVILAGVLGVSLVSCAIFPRYSLADDDDSAPDVAAAPAPDPSSAAAEAANLPLSMETGQTYAPPSVGQQPQTPPMTVPAQQAPQSVNNYSGAVQPYGRWAR